jgi:hypothetical protein
MVSMLEQDAERKKRQEGWRSGSAGAQWECSPENQLFLDVGEATL